MGGFSVIFVVIWAVLSLKERKKNSWKNVTPGESHTAYGVTFKAPVNPHMRHVVNSSGLVEPFEDEGHEEEMGGEMFFIDTMDGETFEEYIGEILKLNGYQNISTTAVTGDYGVDITASKDFVKYAIQCKRWEGSVGVHAVQEVYSGKEYYKANVAMVITNSKFTPNAKQMADKLGVVLIDGEKLKVMIESAKKKLGGTP